jgi:hypothetical protein
MLKIVNSSGRTLSLPPDTVVPVERNNPLFNNDDEFLQDVSYTFFVPFSENSKLFFNLGHLVEMAADRLLIKDVSLYAGGTTLLKGNLRYSVEAEGFQINLEPNFAAINSLIKDIRLTEIRTSDGEFNFTTETFKARMLDSVKFPEKYPYIFFPVHNPGWAVNHFGDFEPFVNCFDFATQTFIPASLSTIAACPFFKVTHIIKEIAAYLGFTATGGIFTDPDFTNRCIYTRRAVFENQIRPCMDYMPNMLLSDFLKFLRQREHLAMDFDLITGELRIESFKSIKNAEAVDLTKYLSADGNQEKPAEQSFTVTLKSDEADEAFLVTDANEQQSYPPDFTLVAGDGKTKLELECGTTKLITGDAAIVPGAYYPSVNQGVIWSQAEYLIPSDLSYTDENDPTTVNNWPLRLFNYDGFLPVDGQFYPCATPHNLNEDDIDFYRFLNDSKRNKPVFYMPAVVFNQLRNTNKFTHRTSGGNFVTYLTEQISYNADADSGLFLVKLVTRLLNYQVDTKVAIYPKAPPVTIDDSKPYYYIAPLKAYFNPLLHGIDVLTVQLVGTAGNNYSVDPIANATNVKGAGGVPVTITAANPMANADPFEIRITQGIPKYILRFGIKTPFTKVGNYYMVSVLPYPPVFYRDFITIFF